MAPGNNGGGTRPKVYMGLAAETINPGVLNVVRTAARLGELTVGVLSDAAVAEYKRLPCLTFEARLELAASLKGVEHVVVQETMSYKAVLERLRPAFVVHGDDWRTGVLSKTRNEVVELLARWGGELVETPYRWDFDNMYKKRRADETVTADARVGMLRRVIAAKGFARVMEVHSGLSALIVENAREDLGGRAVEFDAVWCSSLTTSAIKAKPDTELVDLTARMSVLQDILEATSKPVIYDADTGGEPENFWFMVKTLERNGVSAVIIEDKLGFKRNSLFGTDVSQTQASIPEFCRKVQMGVAAKTSPDFLVISRIESLILGAGQADALERAKAFIQAGSDGIMIHSREKNADEILAFCAAYKKLPKVVPLVVVPSSFNSIHEDELHAAGANIIIHANQLLRASYPAMVECASSILRNGCSKEIDSKLMPIAKVISLIPEGGEKPSRPRVNGGASAAAEPTKNAAAPGRPAKRRRLFTPGPLSVSDGVREACLVDRGSREPAFVDMVRKVRARLSELAAPSGSHECVVVQGSGTFGVESALASHCPGRHVLVLVNGAYGLRLVKILEALGTCASVAAHKVSESRPVTKEDARTALEANPEAQDLLVVHSETSSGLINDLQGVADAARAARAGGRELVLGVDAMSSFGAYPMDLDALGVGFLITSPNKCLQGVPGFALVFATRAIIERTRGRCRSLVLDLYEQHAGLSGAGGQFRFTPPTHCLAALAQALREYDEEGGQSARLQRYQDNHRALIDGMTALGFEPFLAPEHRGCIISSFRYPVSAKWDFQAFYDALAEYGMVIYPGKLTDADTFRVGTIGHLFREDVEALLASVATVKEALGF